MKNPIPCTRWAEMLTVQRPEDLSPIEYQALNAHLGQCVPCAAINRQYQLMATRVRTLPEVRSLSNLTSAEILQQREASTAHGKLAGGPSYKKASSARAFPHTRSQQGVAVIVAITLILLTILVFQKQHAWLAEIVRAAATLFANIHTSAVLVVAGLMLIVTGAIAVIAILRPTQTRKRMRTTRVLFASIIIVVLLATELSIFSYSQPDNSSGQTLTQSMVTQSPTANPSPQVPTSVTLRVTISGSSPTTESNLTVPSGKTVTLTVVPDHSLLPFQTFTMGIYATDPFGFSELQYCTYPHTDTCSYTLSYSASEQTDYTRGEHTFRAFLGNIGGLMTEDSSPVSIQWS